MADDIAIEVRDLWHSYGEKEALRGVSLSVRRGEIVGYLGPNGAGKSTTLKILTGQLRPTKGRVSVLGLDPAEQAFDVRRRLAFVPEVGPLYEVLSGAEHLELVGHLRGLEPRRSTERALELLRALDLEAVAHQPLWTYSRGMRQRVLVAAAFVTRPELVLMDEPLYGLDVQTVMLVKELMRKAAGDGLAVLYSSHLLDVVEQLATRVVILGNGEIVADGSPSELLHRHQSASLEAVFRELSEQRFEQARLDALLP